MGRFAATLQRCFPILEWLPKYNGRDLYGDLVAAVTVGLMVVPQSLAYADLAGLPFQYGLYASWVGPILYTFLGTSKDITVGPTAIMSTLVGSSHSSGPSCAVAPDVCIANAIVLSFVSGAFQLLLGMVGAGFVVNVISVPVLEGFVAAAAVSIATGQLHSLLGETVKVNRAFVQGVKDTVEGLHTAQVHVAALGLGIIALVELLKWAKGRWPRSAALSFLGTSRNAIAVLLAGLVCFGCLHEHRPETFPRPEDIPSGLKPVVVPDFPRLLHAHLIPTAIVIALIGFLEDIAIAKSFAQKNKYKVSGSQELIAVGTANIASSFFSGYPCTGSFSRTAVNASSGVRTPLSGCFMATIVILAIYVLTPAIQFIPKSALSAIIIPAVLIMPDYHAPGHLARHMPAELLCAWLPTFVACLVVGLEYGILSGIGCSTLPVLYKGLFRHKYVASVLPKVSMKVIRSTAGGWQFVAQDDSSVLPQMHPEKDQRPVLWVSHNGMLSFFSANYVQEKIVNALSPSEASSRGDEAAGGMPRAVLLDFSQAPASADVDYTSLQMVRGLQGDCKARGVLMLLVGAPEFTRSKLVSAAIQESIMVPDISTALEKVHAAEQEQGLDGMDILGDADEEEAPSSLASGAVGRQDEESKLEELRAHLLSSEGGQ